MDRKIITSTESTLVTFQPGNGTKYETAFITLPEGGLIFCWLNPLDGKGRSIKLASVASTLTCGYLQGKLRCGEGDAAALLTLIHETTGRAVALPGSTGKTKGATS
jgi:hypothetical protein